jgi:hypothetical protein
VEHVKEPPVEKPAGFPPVPFVPSKGHLPLCVKMRAINSQTYSAKQENAHRQCNQNNRLSFFTFAMHMLTPRVKMQ